MVKDFSISVPFTFCLFILVLNLEMHSQNTIGVLQYDEGIQDGYTLFTTYKDTYLIDNCGQVVNQWTSEYTPGNAVYLLENGDLLRAGNTGSDNFQFGGVGGIIERFDWNGNLIWQYNYDTEEHRQHHDIYPMPNGNILLLAATLLTESEAVAAGRDPSKLGEGKLNNERIIEITPLGSNDATIVWEWNFIDHVIQDFDSTKYNFGVVADNPQRVDINFITNEIGAANWLHINSIQYYEALDQIVLSSRHMDEIYIIDHSTTTEEAAGSSGGTYGKGGDFLYRWGNPQVYDRGNESDRILGGQHYPHFIEEGLADAGKLMVFNNQFTSSPSSSAVHILELPQTEPGFYSITDNEAFGPETPFYTYSSGEEFYSPIVSSAQRLPNGNTLLFEGRFGHITEIDPSENVVWEYIVPISNEDGTIYSQGDDPDIILNITFRAIKYTPDYPAFNGRDLSPKAPIESNPNVSSCVTLSDNDFSLESLIISPNPTKDYLRIKSELQIDSLDLYTLNGQRIELIANNNEINISGLSSGIYVLRINAEGRELTKRIIKQ